MTIDLRRLAITVVVVWLVVSAAFIVLGLATSGEEESGVAALL